MTGTAYRWTAWAGVFLGATTTLLTVLSTVLPKLMDGRLTSQAWFVLSLLGIAVSLISLFLHPDWPDRPSPLHHRAVGFIAVALNCWTWVFWVLLYWFVNFGPIE